MPLDGAQADDVARKMACPRRQWRRLEATLCIFFRMVCGNFFNLHAAFRTRHQGHALRGSVDHHAT